MTTPDDEATPADPAIRVLGDATPEEVAAVVAVLSAVTGSGEDPADAPGSRWVARGPGAWRTPLRP